MNPKSVALIHPPHPNSTEDCLDPPLGLCYLAASIRIDRKDIAVSIVDLSGVAMADWQIPFADIYGLTVYAPSVGITIDIILQCRRINPNCRVVVGGAHASAMPDMFLGIAEHVVVGAGEQAILDILNGERAFVVSNSYIRDLFLPPAFDLLPLERYKRRICGQRSLPVLSSRGCPYHCAFCGLSLFHKSAVTLQKPEQFIRQLHDLVDTYGIRAFGFQDDIFTMSKIRLRTILSAIKEMKLNFRCHGRAGLDTEEVYEWLADAGCTQVAWGIESGSQRMLDRMHKQVKVQDNYDVIRWAKKYGIDSRAFFVLGFPGETAETIEETRRFIETADPDQCFVSSFVPYPGTDVWDNPKKYGVTYIDANFGNYYQVDKNGFGGLTTDTEWLSRAEFHELEIQFRSWFKSRKMRGHLLEYEKA